MCRTLILGTLLLKYHISGEIQLCFFLIIFNDNRKKEKAFWLRSTLPLLLVFLPEINHIWFQLCPLPSPQNLMVTVPEENKVFSLNPNAEKWNNLASLLILSFILEVTCRWTGNDFFSFTLWLFCPNIKNCYSHPEISLAMFDFSDRTSLCCTPSSRRQ